MSNITDIPLQIYRITIPLPEGWREEILWNPDIPEAKGVLARCFFEDQLIQYYPRWYLGFLWPSIKFYVSCHERLHAWGIPASGCMSANIHCIMYESARHTDTWKEKWDVCLSNALAGKIVCCQTDVQYLYAIHGHLRMFQRLAKPEDWDDMPLSSKR